MPSRSNCKNQELMLPFQLLFQQFTGPDEKGKIGATVEKHILGRLNNKFDITGMNRLRTFKRNEYGFRFGCCLSCPVDVHGSFFIDRRTVYPNLIRPILLLTLKLKGV